jgi:hypothetical protein
VSEKQLVKLFQKKPILFFEKVLGATLEDYQARVLQDVADNPRVAISAAHDLGKSWLMARVVLWFGACFPQSKIITTAPTHTQVKSILWSELRTAHKGAKIPLGGQMNLTEWRLSDDWFAMGITSRNEVTGGEGQGTASSFQGWHAPHLLVVFDEATGIPQNIWNMAEGLLTSASTKFVAIGNPTSRASEFFNCFRTPAWKKTYLSCFDSPNLIENGITNERQLEREIDLLRSLNDLEALERMRNYKVVKPWLLSTSWVLGRALKWGITHPLFVSKVLGRFPEESDNALMPLGIIEEAQRRVAYPTASDRRTLGVDVARFGSDMTVLTYLHGFNFIAKKVLSKRDTTQVTGEVLAFCNQHGMPNVIVIDETGLGAGVVDQLNEAQRGRVIPHGIEIRGVQFGSACEHDEDKRQYTNIKARMFDLLGRDLKSGLCLPEEDVYLDELPTILYSYDSKGRMAIESKDDYKRRTGRGSPDHADSLALANYGRYDESRVGVFTESVWDAPGSMTGGMRVGDSW